MDNRMRVKIKKNVLGEEYTIYLYVTPQTMECSLRLAVTEKEYRAKLNVEFSKVELIDKLELKGYGASIPLKGGGTLAGYGASETKQIKHIKLSKINSRRIEEYIKMI